MIAEEIFNVETHLVLPENKLLVASVLPNWTVEIDRSLSGVHTPEQAICFLALARNIDKPLLIPELAEQIIEVDGIAHTFGAKRNPLIRKKEFGEEVLKTAGSLISDLDSAFRYNTILLGRGEQMRLMLLGNVADADFGLRKIEDFFILNPDLKDLHKIYAGFFELAYNKMHPVPVAVLEDSTTPAEATSSIVETTGTQNITEVVFSVPRSPINKIDEVDERPKLPEETAIRDFGLKVRELREGDLFTIDGLFPNYRIGLKADDRLFVAIGLLVEGGYLDEAPGKGSKYIRTDKQFEKTED
ncbi:hypothetical protein KBB49_01340 [Candidatus Saccharibacteria bacterium]|jgi:hypothetical protein|nr:hypothetical protein [Candidatus Saccharibacteria bacterium]